MGMMDETKISIFEHGEFSLYKNVDESVSCYRNLKFIAAFENKLAFCDLYKDFAKEITKLKAENEKLRNCVEFYACVQNWEFDNNNIDDKELIQYSEDDSGLFVVESGGYEDWICGKLARQTLRELEEENNKH